MSDITALTQRIKQRAESAKEFGEQSLYVEANNVLALVEVLEARDKQIAELVAGRLNVQRTMGVYVHAYEEAKSHIASLESRTVTVKLPEVRITVAESKRKNLTWRELGAYNEGADVAAEKISKALAVAGIQIIEGEGQ